MTINEKPGIQPKEISEQLQLTQSTVTRLVEKLEHRGFARREATGRTTGVYPTNQGLELHEEIKAAWLRLYKRYSSILGDDAGKSLAHNLVEANNKLA
jgi:DNA-binding MarR family transcriptional regulator